jgi:diguanylate cyclase (GGDEF)-like protein
MALKQDQDELARLRAEMERLREEHKTQNLRFNTAINNIRQGLCFFDRSQRLIVCNDLYAEMYHLTGDMVRPGTTLREIVDYRYASGRFPDMSRAKYLRWRDSIAISTTPSDTVVKLKDGRTIAIHHQPMPDGGWVATHEDVTDRHQAEQELRAARDELEHHALHDPLTGLANRFKVVDRFKYDAARANRNRTPLSLLMVDIDHFKQINDGHGHLAGDTCLKALAVVLKAATRKVDLVGRFGGEEFVVLLPETSQEQAMIAGERIRRKVEAQPFTIGIDVALPITVSIGAATADGATPISFDELLARADTAMYRAKGKGRNLVCA